MNKINTAIAKIHKTEMVPRPQKLIPANFKRITERARAVLAPAFPVPAYTDKNQSKFLEGKSFPTPDTFLFPFNPII